MAYEALDGELALAGVEGERGAVLGLHGRRAVVLREQLGDRARRVGLRTVRVDPPRVDVAEQVGVGRARVVVTVDAVLTRCARVLLLPLPVDLLRRVGGACADVARPGRCRVVLTDGKLVHRSPDRVVLFHVRQHVEADEQVLHVDDLAVRSAHLLGVVEQLPLGRVELLLVEEAAPLRAPDDLVEGQVGAVRHAAEHRDAVADVVLAVRILPRAQLGDERIPSDDRRDCVARHPAGRSHRQTARAVRGPAGRAVERDPVPDDAVRLGLAVDADVDLVTRQAADQLAGLAGQVADVVVALPW